MKITKGEADGNYKLKTGGIESSCAQGETQGAALYTACQKRQDRPNAILLAGPETNPELKDAQISRAGRHDKGDNRADPHRNPLERSQSGTDGSGDSRSVQPDRSRPGSPQGSQEHPCSDRRYPAAGFGNGKIWKTPEPEGCQGRRRARCRCCLRQIDIIEIGC